MTSRLPAPEVPGLVNDSIDLEKLGDSELLTYINYPGMGSGDSVWPLFKGCGVNGELFDLLESKETIITPDPVNGVAIMIENKLLQDLNGGWVFYSYALDDNGFPGEESQRRFMYVNKAPDAALSLPPAQFLGSHELVAYYEHIDAAGATVTTAPYQAMAINDVVAFTWQYYYEGMPDEPLQLSKTLTQDDLHRPLVWAVDGSYVFEGAADMHYSIEYADGSAATAAPLQRVELAPGKPPQDGWLDAPRIKGLIGDKLDPESYPLGVIVVLEPPPGMQQGDELLLHAQGLDSALVALRVDLTVLDSQRLELRLEQAWLRENVGEKVTLYYQWSRLGEQRRSHPLELTLRRPLNLPSPVVQQAQPEGEDGAGQGFIAPNLIERGALVDIPAGAVIDKGIVEMHWDGHGSTGKFSSTTPTVGNPRRFQIPREAVPANLGRRLNVYYTVTLPGEIAEPSGVFDLRIAHYASNPFKPIQCPQASAGELSRKAVADRGATFRVPDWVFFAEGQRVWMRVAGLNEAGGEVEHVLRDDQPVDEDEYYDGYLESVLPGSFLSSLKENHAFRVTAAVSFDDGETYHNFPRLSIMLVP